MKKASWLLVGLLVMGWLPLQAKAQPGPGKGKGGPPPEAREACKGKSAGDQCEFKNRNGETMQGACTAPPNGGDLGCRPKDAPPPGGGGGGGKGGPPPQVTQACKGKAAGDQCEFKGPQGEPVAGSCVAPPQGGDLNCQPKDLPGMGGGNQDPKVTEACKGKSAGDACEVKGPQGGSMKGSCTIPPMGGDLSCWPNPPGGKGGPGGGKGGGKGGPPKL